MRLNLLGGNALENHGFSGIDGQRFPVQIPGESSLLNLNLASHIAKGDLVLAPAEDPHLVAVELHRHGHPGDDTLSVALALLADPQQFDLLGLNRQLNLGPGISTCINRGHVPIAHRDAGLRGTGLLETGLGLIAAGESVAGAVLWRETWLTILQDRTGLAIAWRLAELTAGTLKASAGPILLLQTSRINGALGSLPRLGAIWRGTTVVFRS